MMEHSVFNVFISLIHVLTLISDKLLISLLSYAKFLELLIYAPSLCILTPSLCEHTTPSDLSGDLTSMPPTRFNIIRHFSTSSGQISLALSPIEDVFELRVPRLQITRGTDKSSPTPTRSGSEAEPPEVVGEKKKILRKEIKRWWEGVSDHIDKLVRGLHFTFFLICVSFLIDANMIVL